MSKKKHYWKIIFKVSALGFLFLVFGLLILFFSYAKNFPRPEVFSERQLSESTKIYDRTGQVLLYEIYGEEKRTWESLSVMPEYLKNAVISAEDANFYYHIGVDWKAIIRAVLADLKIGKPTFGASTIPQQLIRSTFLSVDKTAQRKIREIILALELNRRYSKDQILEWYLNQVPFGQNTYGAEAASQTYFRKPISEISLAEAAVLTALIQAPSYLSPYGEHKTELLARKNYVLDRMKKEGYLSLESAKAAKKEDLRFADSPIELKAPYFTLWVSQLLEKKYGEDFLMTKGLKVYTSLDWDKQQIAETVVRDGVERNKIFNANNAGLVALDPKNGEVLAMTVGTGDYYAEPIPKGCNPGKDCLFDPKFNVVVGTKDNPGRQPGSAFKPLIYATAFKKGYDDKYIVIDELTNFGIWGDKEYVPQNYDGKFRGPVTLRQALSQSLNIPAVKVLLNLAGLEDSIKTAEDFGITTLKPPFGPSIVLGGWEVKLLDITSAYGVFAAEGLKSEPAPILKIEDEDGNIIFKKSTDPKRVLEIKASRIINNILSDNEARTPMFGPRSSLFLENYQVAAKTGTTDNFKDAWTIGYTPSIVVGVWAGNNDGTPLEKKQPAATIAGPIFHNFLEKIIQKIPVQPFISPS